MSHITHRARAIVKFDFAPSDESQLQLRVGDVVDLFEIEPDDNGWFEGELYGQVGYFPASYVHVLGEDESDVVSFDRFERRTDRLVDRVQMQVDNQLRDVIMDSVIPSQADIPYAMNTSHMSEHSVQSTHSHNGSSMHHASANDGTAAAAAAAAGNGHYSQESDWIQTRRMSEVIRLSQSTADGPPDTLSSTHSPSEIMQHSSRAAHMVSSSHDAHPSAAAAHHERGRSAHDKRMSLLRFLRGPGANSPPVSDSVDDEEAFYRSAVMMEEEEMQRHRSSASQGKPGSNSANRSSHSRVGVLASKLAIVGAFCSIMGGIVAFIWAMVKGRESERRESLHASVGTYGIVLGLFVIAYEVTATGRNRSSVRIPWRAFGYSCASVALFFSMPLWSAGMLISMCALVNFYSAYLGEHYHYRSSLDAAFRRTIAGYDALLPDDDSKSAAGDVSHRHRASLLSPSSHSLLELDEAAAYSTQSFRRPELCSSAWFHDMRHNLTQWWADKEELNLVKHFLLLAVYMTLNFVCLVYVIFSNEESRIDKPRQVRPGIWQPIAAGWGAVCTLNAAMLLLPIMRSLVRAIQRASNHSDNNCVSELSRVFLELLPAERNVIVHKFMFWVMVISGTLHAFFHFLHYAESPYWCDHYLGMWPYVSGSFMVLALGIMWAGSRDEVRADFGVMWWTHQSYFVFYIMLLLHGRNYWNTEAWKYLVGPISLYVIERIVRWKQAGRVVILSGITFMAESIMLHIDKKGQPHYHEGQYLFLNCPLVSAPQWIPVPLSSSPYETKLTVTIGTAKPGTWGHKLRRVLHTISSVHKHREKNQRKGHVHMGSDDNPHNVYAEPLTDSKVEAEEVALVSFHDVAGTQLSATLAQSKAYTSFESSSHDGIAFYGYARKPLLRVDGPYSSPMQRFVDYQDMMIAASGTGVSSAVSILKSNVHRWNFYQGDEFNHIMFVWSVDWSALREFAWVVQDVAFVADAFSWLRACEPERVAGKTFELHMHVIGAPPLETLHTLEDISSAEIKDPISLWGAPSEQHVGFYRRMETNAIATKTEFALLDKLALLNAMLRPINSLEEFGVVSVHRGLPTYRRHLSTLAANHSSKHKSIGVFFNGDRANSTKLATACQQSSDAKNGLLFVLHKEVGVFMGDSHM
jgi:Variant SH3 domain/FAD-binding domain